MSTEAKLLYEFGDFCLDLDKRVLLRDGDPVPLTPKAFDTLRILVRRSGHVVGKDELLREVWPDTFVEEATLAQNVFTLRKALGQGRTDQQYIETVPKYGYRFVAHVRALRDDSTEEEVVLERHTRTHIVTEELEDTHPHTEEEKASASSDEILSGSNGHRTFDAAPAPIRNPRLPAAADAMSYALRIMGGLRHHRKAALAVMSLVIVMATAALFLQWRRSAQTGAGTDAPFQKMRISKLTNQGKAVLTAISPDGKYIVNMLKDGRAESIWLRQATATNNIQVVPPADVRYQGVTFSPDSSSIYYVVYPKDGFVASLYQVPVLGGIPKEVLTDIDSIVTFSPDGKQLAFVRNYLGRNDTSLIVANVDGTEQRQLATRSLPYYFAFDGPAWSPDGSTIICAAGKTELNQPSMSVAEVRLKDGSERLLTSRTWDSIGQVAWLSDSSGIVMEAWDSSVSLLAAQIWQLSYLGGEARRITNDMNSYHGVSMTASNGALVTVQSDRATNLWVGPTGDIEQAKRITSGTGDLVGESMGIAWTPDGRIVYGSNASGGLDVWIMNSDGSNQKQLTTDAPPDVKPSVSPDGRVIVFVSWRTGKTHLWRMDVDGTNLRQLTNGSGETYPNISPDGQWIVYSAVEQDRPTLWKISIEGGEPVKLNNAWAIYPSISPDGKMISSYYKDEPRLFNNIALIPFEGGDPVKVFDLPPTVFIQAGIHWAADGSALTYIDNRDGVSNIWSQPLDGGAPKQLTNFTSDQIFRFAWARDGKRLAFERGVELKDVTLISNFR